MDAASTKTEQASADDGETRGGESYSQYDDRRDRLATGQFSGGDECTEDCGGHDAGREWSESKGIIDPGDCGGKVMELRGCRSYAAEQSSDEPADRTTR